MATSEGQERGELYGLIEAFDGSSALAPPLLRRQLSATTNDLGDLLEQLDNIHDVNWPAGISSAVTDRKTFAQSQQSSDEAWAMIKRIRNREARLALLQSIVRRYAYPSDSDSSDPVHALASRSAQTLLKQGLIQKTIRALSSLLRQDDKVASGGLLSQGGAEYQTALAGAIRLHTRKAMMLELLILTFKVQPCPADAFQQLATLCLDSRMRINDAQADLLCQAVQCRPVAARLVSSFTHLMTVAMLHAINLRSITVPLPSDIYDGQYADNVFNSHPLLSLRPASSFVPLMELCLRFKLAAQADLKRCIGLPEGHGLPSPAAWDEHDNANAIISTDDLQGSDRGEQYDPSSIAAEANKVGAGCPFSPIAIALATLVQLHIARLTSARNAGLLAAQRGQRAADVPGIVSEASKAFVQLCRPVDLRVPDLGVIVTLAAADLTHLLSAEAPSPAGSDPVAHPVDAAISVANAAEYLRQAIESLCTFMPATHLMNASVTASRSPSFGFGSEASPSASDASASSTAWEEMEDELSMPADGPGRRDVIRARMEAALARNASATSAASVNRAGPACGLSLEAGCEGELLTDASGQNARATAGSGGTTAIIDGATDVDKSRTCYAEYSQHTASGVAGEVCDIARSFLSQVISARLSRRDRPVPSPFNAHGSAELLSCIALLRRIFFVQPSLANDMWIVPTAVDVHGNAMQVAGQRDPLFAILRAAKLWYPANLDPLLNLCASMCTSKAAADAVAQYLATETFTYTAADSNDSAAMAPVQSRPGFGSESFVALHPQGVTTSIPVSRPWMQRPAGDATRALLCLAEKDDVLSADELVSNDMHLDFTLGVAAAVAGFGAQAEPVVPVSSLSAADSRAAATLARLPVRDTSAEIGETRLLTSVMSFSGDGISIKPSDGSIGIPVASTQSSTFGSSDAQVVIWTHKHSAWAVVVNRLQANAAAVAAAGASMAVLERVIRSASDASTMMTPSSNAMGGAETQAALATCSGLIQESVSVCRFLEASFAFSSSTPSLIADALVPLASAGNGSAARARQRQVVQSIAQCAVSLLTTYIPLARASSAVMESGATALANGLRSVVEDARVPAKIVTRLLSTISSLYTDTVASLLLGCGPDAGGMASAATVGTSASAPLLTQILTAAQNDVDTPVQRFALTLPLLRAAQALTSHILRKRSRPDLTAAFSIFDRDGGGSIDIQEFQSTLQGLGHSLRPEVLSKMIRSLDINGSGVIDYSEFVRFVNERPPLTAAGASDASTPNGSDPVSGVDAIIAQDALDEASVAAEMQSFIASITGLTPSRIAAENAFLFDAFSLALRTLQAGVQAGSSTHLGARLMLQIRALDLLEQLLRSKAAFGSEGKSLGLTVAETLIRDRPSMVLVLHVMHQLPIIAASIMHAKVVAKAAKDAAAAIASLSAGGEAENKKEADEASFAASSPSVPAVTLPLDFAPVTGQLSVSDRCLLETATLSALSLLNRLLSAAPPVSGAMTAEGRIPWSGVEYMAVVKADAIVGFDSASAASRILARSSASSSSFLKHGLAAIDPVTIIASLIGYDNDVSVMKADADGGDNGASDAAQKSRYLLGLLTGSPSGLLSAPCIQTAAIATLTLLSSCMSSVTAEIDMSASSPTAAAVPAAAAIAYRERVRYDLARYLKPHAVGVRQLLFGSGGINSPSNGTTGSRNKVSEAVLIGGIQLARSLLAGQPGAMSILLSRDFEQLSSHEHGWDDETVAAWALVTRADGDIQTASDKDSKHKAIAAKKAALATFNALVQSKKDSWRWAHPSLLPVLMEIITAAPKSLLPVSTGGDFGPKLVCEALALVLSLWRSACESSVHSREVNHLRTASNGSLWASLIAIIKQNGGYAASASAAGATVQGEIPFPGPADIGADGTSSDAGGSMLDASLALDYSETAPTIPFNVHSVTHHAFVVQARALAMDIIASELLWQSKSASVAPSDARTLLPLVKELLLGSATASSPTPALLELLEAKCESIFQLAHNPQLPQLALAGLMSNRSEAVVQAAASIGAIADLSSMSDAASTSAQVLLTSTLLDFSHAARLASMARSAAQDAGVPLLAVAQAGASLAHPIVVGILPPLLFPSRSVYGSRTAHSSVGDGMDAAVASTDPIRAAMQLLRGPVSSGVRSGVAAAATYQPPYEYGTCYQWSVVELSHDLGLSDAWLHMLSTPIRASGTESAQSTDEGQDGDGMAVGTSSGAPRLMGSDMPIKQIKLAGDARALWAAALHSVCSSLLAARMSALKAYTGLLGVASAAAVVPVPAEGTAAASPASSAAAASSTLYLHAATVAYSRLASYMPRPGSVNAIGTIGQDASTDGACIAAANALADSGCVLLGQALPGLRLAIKSSDSGTDGLYRCLAAVLLCLRHNALRPSSLASPALVQAGLQLETSLQASALRICEVICSVAESTAALSADFTFAGSVIGAATAASGPVAVRARGLILYELAQAAGNGMLVSMQSLEAGSAVSRDYALATQSAASKLYATAGSLLCLLIRQPSVQSILRRDADKQQAFSSSPASAASAHGLPEWLLQSISMAQQSFTACGAHIAATLAAHESEWASRMEQQIASAEAFIASARAPGSQVSQRLTAVTAVVASFTSMSREGAAAPPDVAMEIDSCTRYMHTSLQLAIQVAGLGAQGGSGAIADAAVGWHQAIATSPLFAHVEEVINQRVIAGVDRHVVPSKVGGDDGALLTPTPIAASAVPAGPTGVSTQTTSSTAALPGLVSRLKAIGVDAGAAAELAFAASGFGLGPSGVRGYTASNDRCALHAVQVGCVSLMTTLLKLPTASNTALVLQGQVKASSAMLAEGCRLTFHTAMTSRAATAPCTIAGAEEASCIALFLAALYSTAAPAVPPASAIASDPVLRVAGVTSEAMTRFCASAHQHWLWRGGASKANKAAPPALQRTAPAAAAYLLRDMTIALGPRPLPESALKPASAGAASSSTSVPVVSLDRAASGVVSPSAAFGIVASSAAEQALSAGAAGDVLSNSIADTTWRAVTGTSPSLSSMAGGPLAFVPVSAAERAAASTAGSWNAVRDSALGHVLTACATLCEAAQSAHLHASSQSASASSTALVPAGGAAPVPPASDADMELNIDTGAVFAEARRIGETPFKHLARVKHEMRMQQQQQAGSYTAAEAASPAAWGGESSRVLLGMMMSPAGAAGGAAPARTPAATPGVPRSLQRSASGGTGVGSPGMNDAYSCTVERVTACEAATRARRRTGTAVGDGAAKPAGPVFHPMMPFAVPNAISTLAASGGTGGGRSLADQDDVASLPRPSFAHLALALQFAMAEGQAVLPPLPSSSLPRYGAALRSHRRNTSSASPSPSAGQMMMGASSPTMFGAGQGGAAAAPGFGFGPSAHVLPPVDEVKQLYFVPAPCIPSTGGASVVPSLSGAELATLARSCTSLLALAVDAAARGAAASSSSPHALLSLEPSIRTALELIVKTVGDAGVFGAALDIIEEIDSDLADGMLSSAASGGGGVGAMGVGGGGQHQAPVKSSLTRGHSLHHDRSVRFADQPLPESGPGAAGSSARPHVTTATSIYSSATGMTGGGVGSYGRPATASAGRSPSLGGSSMMMMSLVSTTSAAGGASGQHSNIPSAVSHHTRLTVERIAYTAGPYCPGNVTGIARLHLATSTADVARARTALLQHLLHGGQTTVAAPSSNSPGLASASSSASGRDAAIDGMIAGSVCGLFTLLRLQAQRGEAAAPRSADFLTPMLTGGWEEERRQAEDQDNENVIPQEDRRRLRRGDSGDYRDAIIGRSNSRSRSRSRSRSTGRGGSRSPGMSTSPGQQQAQFGASSPAAGFGRSSSAYGAGGGAFEGFNLLGGAARY